MFLLLKIVDSHLLMQSQIIGFMLNNAVMKNNAKTLIWFRFVFRFCFYFLKFRIEWKAVLFGATNKKETSPFEITFIDNLQWMKTMHIYIICFLFWFRRINIENAIMHKCICMTWKLLFISKFGVEGSQICCILLLNGFSSDNQNLKYLYLWIIC